MLLKVNLISSKQMITYNYKYYLNTIIYSLIKESNIDLANQLHGGLIKRKDGKSFRPFVFSDLIFEKQRNLKEGKEVEGFGSFYFSSSDVQIMSIIKSVMNKKILLFGSEIYISNVESIIDLDLSNDYFYTKSPILTKIKKGKLQEFLHPEHKDFIPKVKKNLIKKYLEVTGKVITENDFVLKVVYVKGEVLERYKNERFYKGYYCIFEFIGPTELKEVAIQLGLGIYNCQGFGMIYPQK